MKNFKLTTAIALVASSVLMSSAAIAAESSGAYVTDSSGNEVTGPQGKCIQTSSWSEETANKKCNPELFPDPVVAAAPVYESINVSTNALFGFDNAAISAEGEAALQALGDGIQAKGAKVVDIDIIGHTDSTGPEEYNQALSERRANAIRDFIVSKGVDASIIDVSGMGESSPIADNATEEGRAQNRRVEVRVGAEQ